MEKRKKKYKGFLIRRDYSDGQVKVQKKFVGYTSATSEKRAVNNIRFRVLGCKSNSYTYDFGYDESVTETFEVEEVG